MGQVVTEVGFNRFEKLDCNYLMMLESEYGIQYKTYMVKEEFLADLERYYLGTAGRTRYRDDDESYKRMPDGSLSCNYEDFSQDEFYDYNGVCILASLDFVDGIFGQGVGDFLKKKNLQWEMMGCLEKVKAKEEQERADRQKAERLAQFQALKEEFGS